MKIHNYKILLFLILILSSCNINRKSGYVIGVSQCSDDLWRQTMNEEMLREASFYQDVEVIIKTVSDDTPRQIADIESFISAGVDLLIISPNESAAITPVVSKAFQTGIPVILVDRKIESDDYTAYIGADNYYIGSEAGLYIASLLNGKGNVVEIRGWNGSTSDKERHEGFRNVLENYPAIRIIAERRGNYLKEEAEKQISDVLKNHSQIDLVFAFNDPMAVGVYHAVVHYSGRYPFIIGIDALAGAGGGIENILNGIQDASLIYPTGGDRVIELAIDILEGKEVHRENLLSTAIVDKNNARVIKLQHEQIALQQQKLDSMNRIVLKSLEKYSTQQTLLYAVVIILLLLALLFVFSVIAYRNKSRANALLAQQNREIKQQAEILAQQKEQLVQLSTQLEEATHAKLVFFTNISHEFRTPLTLILGPVDSLRQSSGLTPMQYNLLDLVKRNSNILLSLISQVIEFRSYENGKMKVTLSNSDFIKYLEELNIAFSDYAERKRLDFSFEAASDSMVCAFDREKIEKIYFNILSNAFKHTNPGGKISIRINRLKEEEREYIGLQIHNTGKPIPEDKIQHVFDRFFKVNPHDAGTGIGLALTSALVKIQEGKISVESREGYGTVFRILLPFIEECKEENEDGCVSESSYIPNQINIDSSFQPDEVVWSDSVLQDNKPLVLLIEDNADLRSFMCTILQEEYAVIQSEDGEKGLEKARKYVPDIIISDVMMPEKDGFEVCRLLKENISTSHIPVILLTACSLDEQKAAGFESGADAYIPKPFNADLLRIRIRKLIENRRKIKEAFGKSLVSETKKTSLAGIEQKFLDKFRECIEASIADPELNVDSVAGEMGLSKSQLYRKIKSLTDYSPNELIKIIRLKYARQLLADAGRNITDVAYESGFSSLSYFTKCYKEFFKENPAKMKKNN